MTNDWLVGDRRVAAAERIYAAAAEIIAADGIDAFGPLVVDAFRGRTSELLSEIDDNPSRYEGREETWFSRFRQVRNHSEWGPRLFRALHSDEGNEAD